jgi:hypothetical protein
MSARHPVVVLPVLLSLLCLACGRPQTAEAEDADLRRERAAALYTEERPVDALAALQPLLERDEPAIEDVVRAGIIELALDQVDAARAHAEQAWSRTPADPAVNYLRGNIQLRDLEFEQAAASFRAVLETDPQDLAARIRLAYALDTLGETDEPMRLWEEVRARGVDEAGALYQVATFRLARRYIIENRMEEGQALTDEHRRVEEERGIKSPQPQQIEQSGHGRLMPPTRRPLAAGPPAAPQWPAYEVLQTVALGDAAGLLAADLDADGRVDLCAWGPGGVTVARQREPGVFTAQQVVDRPVLHVAAGDLDAGTPPDAEDPQDPRRDTFHPPLELACVEASDGPTGGGAIFVHGLDQDSDSWQGLGPNGIQPAGARWVEFSDFDHDGWADLVVAGASGLRLMRNTGTARSALMQLPDVTPDAASELGASRAVLAEDFDGDNDVDYLVLTEGGLALLSNLRSGAFEDVSASWNLPAPSADAGEAAGTHLAAADLDLDARPDLLLPVAGGLAWARNEGDRFGAPQLLVTEAGPLSLADLDLDGRLDLLAALPGGLTAWRGPLPDRSTPPPSSVLGTPVVSDGAAPLAADVDGDGDVDLLAPGPGGVTLLGPTAAAAGSGLPLRLGGHKDNPAALGAIVELRAGPIYRRLYWRGGPVTLGLGEQGVADVVRVTWPNGVIQHAIDTPAGTPLLVEQVERLVGSCPFLYTWNGATFTFVSDVLGATPLGLPMAPGRFVPFDHEEYVKVRGDQLVPREGVLEIALTEELREVTYLDEVRLHAIDHPAEVEIEPDEGFVFPPFPPHHVHTFREVRAPVRVTSGEGEDLTDLVAVVDERHARPFRPAPWVLMGLAEPWSLEIVLAETAEQRAELEAAPRLRLALTGWFQWSDASVNLAAARHPDWSFDPPQLWVPDGEGWTPAGPPTGFPAGKTKTLVVDVTGIVKRDDPRLLMTTSLQLSWDAIRLVIDDDDAPYRDTRLEPLAAELSFRGFSAPLPDPGGSLPERFDWDVLDEPRWNQHPGRYTGYGDVLPLLGSVDDRYVIFGAGDALTVSFDASALPELPAGWTRDWLVYLDGWAKDGDHNTAAAEAVEPLPFHGMSAYPPPAGEGFPWDEAHLAWDREWNTRRGAVLIPPLAPVRPQLVRADAR